MTAAASLAGGPELAMGLVRLLCVGAAVTLCAHILGLALARQAAATRVTVWRAAVVALLLVPAGTLLLPRWHVPQSAAITNVAHRLQQLWVDAQSLSERPDIAAAPHAPGVPELDPSTGPRVTTAHALRAFAMLWGAVATAALGYLLAGLILLRVSARRALDVTEPILAEMTLPRTGWWLRLRVLRGGPFRVPLCWGVLKPTVMLPWGSESWTLSRTSAVLLHEATHVERRDGLFLILARLASAVHWLNPLAWSVQRRLSLDAEVACDAEVVRKGVPAREYARTLVDVAAEAQRRRQRPSVALALVPMGSLSYRVEQILERRSAPPRRMLATASASALVMVALAGASVAYGPRSAESAPGVASRPMAARDGSSFPTEAPAVASRPAGSASDDANVAVPAVHPSQAVDPMVLPGIPELVSPTLDETTAKAIPAVQLTPRDVGGSLALAVAEVARSADLGPPRSSAALMAQLASDGPRQVPSSLLPFRRTPAFAITMIRAPLMKSPATYDVAVMAAVAERFAITHGIAYSADELGDASQANLFAFLMDEMDWQALPCRAPDKSLGCIGDPNGGVVRARLYVDDKLVTGLETLIMRSPREFYQVEISGAATIRAYTHSYAIAFANSKAQEAATRPALRANY